jgi:hypothetical protein
LFPREETPPRAFITPPANEARAERSFSHISAAASSPTAAAVLPVSILMADFIGAEIGSPCGAPSIASPPLPIREGPWAPRASSSGTAAQGRHYREPLIGVRATRPSRGPHGIPAGFRAGSSFPAAVAASSTGLPARTPPPPPPARPRPRAAPPPPARPTLLARRGRSINAREPRWHGAASSPCRNDVCPPTPLKSSRNPPADALILLLAFDFRFSRCAAASAYHPLIARHNDFPARGKGRAGPLNRPLATTMPRTSNEGRGERLPAPATRQAHYVAL